MKKTWIALSLALAMCLPLAGCAGDKTGGEITPGTDGSPSPTAQTTPTAAPTPGNDAGEDNTDAANGGNNVSGAPVGDENARVGTARSAGQNAGRADDSMLERIGDGVKDTLDDLSDGARRMAQDAKRAME